jgi:hypothetical protein
MAREISYRDAKSASSIRIFRIPLPTYKERTGFMKAATIVGILLIAVAIVGFAMGGISFTHEKKVIDMGPVQVSHKEEKTLPISPILSTLALVAGVGLVVVGVRGR